MLGIESLTPFSLRLSLALMPIATGLLGSLSTSFIKAVTVCFKDDGLSDWPVYVYIFIGIIFGLFQLTAINKSMEIFDQIDTVPIYLGSLILLSISAGAIIL